MEKPKSQSLFFFFLCSPLKKNPWTRDKVETAANPHEHKHKPKQKPHEPSDKPSRRTHEPRWRTQATKPTNSGDKPRWWNPRSQAWIELTNVYDTLRRRSFWVFPLFSLLYFCRAGTRVSNTRVPLEIDSYKLDLLLSTRDVTFINSLETMLTNKIIWKWVLFWEQKKSCIANQTYPWCLAHLHQL